MKYIWLQMADEGDSSSEGEKSEQRDELELHSSNSDVSFHMPKIGEQRDELETKVFICLKLAIERLVEM